MLRINYSNRIDRLVDALVDGVGDRSADPLAPVTVVVPNQHVATFLKYAIARRTGIAANFEFPFLDSFLAACVGDDRRALDRARMHALLCNVLDDDDVLARDDVAPVRHYIDAGRDSDDEWALRRFQLAGHLADLFTEYSLARPDLLAAWQTDDSASATGAGAWQRAVYRAATDALASVRRASGVEWLALPELFERARGTLRDVPPRVHLFGFSYVARAYYRIFETLAQATDLRVYALNPCREFWEDVQKQRGADAAPSDADCLPLRWWGAPGRDHVGALTALTDGDFDDWYESPGTSTLLARVQSDVLARRAAPAAPVPADDTIRVLACPGVRREAEIIAAEIWRLVEADASLSFSDIAVLVSSADRELYQTHLAAAFRAARDIPHAIADIAASRESRIVEAVDQLVALPYGTFGRRDLLRLMTNPAVVARFPDVDVADWLRWADDLAIVHGADRDDHRGTYIRGDRFNWDQGIHRLALGAFMAGDRSDPTASHDRWYEIGGDAYLPAEHTQDQTRSAAHFAVLARSLIADARYCRGAHKPLAEWSALLGRLVAGYLRAPTEDEERELDQCLRAVEGIADLDLDGRPVPYRIAAEMVRQALGGLRMSRGAMFTSGVVIAPHVPMRPQPFRVVFVAGLGEGRFPAPDRESPLDLRQHERRRGDVTARERDKYLFLETLAAARERLYLTYVARDEQTGEALQPASPVQELVHLLDTGYQVGRDIVEHHPLRRYAEPVRDALPEAEREAQALSLRQHLLDHLGGHRAGGQFPSLDELRAQLPAERWNALARALDLPPPPPADDDRPREAITLSLYALRQFLECPLQASASFLLGLRRDDDDDDVFDLDDEPFATAPLPEAVLLRDVFLTALSEQRSMAAVYAERSRRVELEGKTPTGLFREVDRDRHLRMLEQWRANLGVAGDYKVYRFGRAQERSQVDELRPPIVLDVDGQRVELFGKTEPLCTAVPGSVTLVRRDPLESYYVRGFVTYVVAAATGIAADVPYTVVVNPPSAAVGRRTYAPLSQDDARAYLTALVGDLISRVHDYLLPIEIVKDYVGGDRSIDEVVASRLRRQYPGIASQWGPVRGYRQFGPPADADDIVDHRLARYLEGGDQ